MKVEKIRPCDVRDRVTDPENVYVADNNVYVSQTHPVAKRLEDGHGVNSKPYNEKFVRFTVVNCPDTAMLIEEMD